ncbi:MAG: hypothetical protein RIR18_639 [Pseudomonadota bacterium]|jgi:diguanylate cyclase (GGDEF)-like protein
MNHSPKRTRRGFSGRTSISRLLLIIFLAGLVVSSFVVYSVFLTYRVSAVSDMAKADGRRISHLVFEHFYSVMRKGATRGEIDDLVHHIQNQLPDYEVTIIRGEPVVRQFGDRPGQADLRVRDKMLSEVLQSGEEYSGASGANLRYLFPIKVTGECAGCHTKARIGEINGVIAVSVPLAALEAPIAAFAHPIMWLALGLVMALLVITFLVLRRRVSLPIVDLADHVSAIYQSADYSRDLVLSEGWPREVRGLAANFNGLMGQVRTSHDQLREFSLRDPLTGLFNRRHFDAAIEQAVVDAQNGGPVFAVLLIDLDRFKPINDQYGHAAGDAMLISVGNALMSAVRGSDLAARVGGDEFAVLALTTNHTEAKELAERLRQAVEASAMRFGHEIIHASCSIGIAVLPENGRRASDLMRAADVAMYANKLSRQGGRE